MDTMFFVNSIAIGAGLAMDAFSVSLANGLNEPNMKRRKAFLIALIFAIFQAAMPIIGWVCVHTIVGMFSSFEKFVPWIAFILLSFIGIKMLLEGINNKDDQNQNGKAATFGALIVQGVATSIDALSTGFTISDYSANKALLCAFIIALVTFIICYTGVNIGKRFGVKLAGTAGIFGGIILILIGIEIFITSF